MPTYYNGYQLSANPDVTGEKLSASFQSLTDVFSEIVEKAEKKYTELETFASQEPSVSLEPISIDLAEVTTSVSEAIESAIADICSIIQSIVDYGDGTWDNENNKLFLDTFMQNNNLSYYPRYGDDGEPANNDDNSDESSDNSDESSDNSDESSDNSESNDSDNNTGDPNAGNTDDPDTGVYAPSYNESDSWSGSGDYSVPFVGQGLEEKSSDDAEEKLAIDDVTDALSSAGTSSGFFVPSITTSKTSGVKSSGSIGAAGIVAAAAAAVAGKIYYDTKKEEEYTEEDIEKPEYLSGEIDSEDIDDNSMSGLNMVEFKEELINIGEEDE